MFNSVPHDRGDFCKICHSSTTDFAQATVLQRYQVHYVQCNHCGFVQTEAPYWLEEAYTSAIAGSDVGLVYRNLQLSQTTKHLIFHLFDHNLKFLDYGGGYGLFVRLMRDAGFDFYWYDKFATNLFAQGFEAESIATTSVKTNVETNSGATNSEPAFELVTAFEVFEHLVDPLAELQAMLQFSHSILFSTELLPEHYPKPGDWWYYCTDEGQHISFFTLKSLHILAQKFNLNLYSQGTSARNGMNLHLLTPNNLDSVTFQAVLQHQLSAGSKPSRLGQDCQLVKQKLQALSHSKQLLDHPPLMMF